MEQDSSGAFVYTLVCGLITGVALALVFNFGVVCLLVMAGTALGLITLGALTRYKKLFLVATCIAAALLGVLRAESFLSQQKQSSLLPYVTVGRERVMVEGVVVTDPERRATSLHVTLAVKKINGKSLPASRQGELLAMLDRDQSVAYGDTVVLRGSITEPQPFETNTGHLFDYKGYLEVQGISAMMPYAAVMGVLPDGLAPQFILQTVLFDTKHLFEQSVEKIFPEPDNFLLEGILLGERRGIPPNLMQAFVASGLVHVVVLSGHNITIVSEGVFRALAFLPRTAGYGVGAFLMIMFAFMTGAGATTVRALIMALVALLARYVHRSALALRSLAVAAAAMVLWNPPSLLHDPSFMLSVLATFGLITLAPWVEQKISRVPNYKRFDLRSIIATTIAVEIFVTPALLYFNGVLSFFALPANILALPAIPLAMLSGFISGLLGLLSPSLALLPAIICDMLLKWIMLVATTVESTPFSTAIAPQFSVWILVAVYVPLTWFAISVYRSAAR